MQMRTRKATALWPVALVFAALFLIPSLVLAQNPAKLLITQVEVHGDEYVVIKNPGSTSVDLSNYYLTDATYAAGNQYYYNLPDPSLPVGGGAFYDFVARFPEGASIAPGQEVTVSIGGSDGFFDQYGVMPHFELYEDGVSADDVPDMRPARTGSIVDNEAQLPSLSNSGEVVILFYWNGETDLVTDVDYVIWGDTAEAVDKTGVSIDGPDADSTPSAYLPDTPIAQQELVPSPSVSGVFVRVDETEGTQKTSGGNGVDGRDETSENLSATFTMTEATPPGVTPNDTTPPVLVSAAGEAGSSTVTVTFSEAVGTGASTPGNYEVYPTANPGNGIAVTGATVSGATVTLALGSALESGTQYTVRVNGVQDLAGNVIAANSTVSFTTGAAGGEFAVAGAFQFGADYVGVAFTDKVDATSALQTGNYGFSPSLDVTGAVLQENGQTVILQTGSALPTGTSYTVTVSGVTSQGGGSLTGGTASFTTATESVTNIAEIQGNVSSYVDQTVTVVGQVFVTASSSGGTPSAYIQDGSGRGLNVFGSGQSGPLDDRGTVAKVTGTVAKYFETTEITGYTASALATGMPKLAPKVLTVEQAQSSQWEGTYIQTTSTLTSDPSASGTHNYNYPAEGITFRVRNAAGIDPSQFHAGDVVTGAGFGSKYQDTYQIGVGNADDFSKSGGTGDTTPPTLGSASGEVGSNRVLVVFSEPVGEGASTPGNYEVFPTQNPSAPLTVTAARVNGASVTLTLGSKLEAGAQYTVRVHGIQDLAGNMIQAGSSVTFTVGEAKPRGARLTVPPRTLVKDMKGEGEAIEIKIEGEPNTIAVLRIFDLQGRLVRVLYDGPISSAPNPITWDGRDQTFELVRSGMYICHLQTTDLAGKVTEDQAPIVVAARLD